MIAIKWDFNLVRHLDVSLYLMSAEVRNLKSMKRLTILPCLMHLLWFFASISFQVCSAIDKISVTQPLQDPNFLVSSGGTFKLGFFSPENTTNRYVGILYNVPKMEAVWVANRDKPLNDSSGVFTVSEDGNLVILSGNGVKLWSSNASSPVPNPTAQLMESGNLVLRDGSNGRSVWESFEHPTDSFLAGMRIGGSGNGTIQLSSWRSPSDPSTGSFMFGLNSKQIPEVYLLKRGVLFWRSGPWDGRVFIGAPGHRRPLYGSRLDVITGNAGEAYLAYDNKNASILPHIKIIESGDLQEVALSEEGDWVLAYLKERTECDVYGKCGPNGICDPKGSPICSCLQGFEPRDKEEWTKGNWTAGCSRKSLLQCDRNNSAGQQGEGDGYLMRRMVKIPDFYNIISTPECSNSCLEDCSCSAYTFVVGIGCMHWTHDSLIDVQQFSIRGSDLYIRVAHSELDHATSNKGKKAIVSIAVSVGFLFLALSLFIFWQCWNKYRGKLWKTNFMLDDSLENSKLAELHLYTYHTLAIATDHFHASNKLGQGGFGPVYKGQLLDGQEIAVKMLSNSSSQGMKEFMNEVTLISSLQHCNLVRLLGSCVERGEKLLVYEFLPNKSLDTYIFDLQKKDLLDWNRRCLIIEGIGRGLLYLHRDSRLKIIHRDLKASNILLDEELNPKISDFGLARIFGGKQDQANTNRVVGTYGYMAPEYALGGKFSDKSDVYSFGVLLLEIVSGKRNTSFYLDEDNLSLLGYAWKLWKKNEAVNLAFTEQLDTAIEMEIRRSVQVGLLCVQDNPNDRPNMSNVLLMLNSEMTDIPLPKFPVYTSTFLVSEVRCNSQSRPSNSGISLTELQGR